MQQRASSDEERGVLVNRGEEGGGGEGEVVPSYIELEMAALPTQGPSLYLFN